MNLSKTSLLIVIAFTWMSVLLSLFGIVNMDYTEIISYILIFLGTAIFFPSFLQDNNTGIFTGSLIFLTGLTLFITVFFEIRNSMQVFVPAALIIISVSLLMIFISDLSEKKFLFLSLLTGIIGIYILLEEGNSTVDSFAGSIKLVFSKSWIVLLLVVVTIVLITLERRSSRRK